MHYFVIPRHIQWNHVRFWGSMSRSYGQIFHFGNVVIIPYLWLLWNVNTVCNLKRETWYSLNCTIHGMEIQLLCYQSCKWFRNRNQIPESESTPGKLESESELCGTGIGIRIMIFGKPWNRNRNHEPLESESESES